MLYKVCYIFIIFLIYSLIGWILEIGNSLVNEKKFVNCGFFIGPYCPIYGVGVLLITYLLHNYTDNFLVLFILAMVLCMALEYVTSLLLELLFHARWWDYSNRKYNINGRICLETAIPFGIMGSLIMYILNPIVYGMMNKLLPKFVIILGLTLMLLFIIDAIITFNVVIKFRKKANRKKDETEEINKIIKNIFFKRLIASFPNLKKDKTI